MSEVGLRMLLLSELTMRDWMNMGLKSLFTYTAVLLSHHELLLYFLHLVKFLLNEHGIVWYVYGNRNVANELYFLSIWGLYELLRAFTV